MPAHFLTMAQSSARAETIGGQLGIDNTTDMGDDPGEMGDNLPSVKL